MKNTLVFIAALITIGSLASAGNIPPSWYQLPEDKKPADHTIGFEKAETENITSIEENIDSIFRADQEALNYGLKGDSIPPKTDFVSKPKDLVPWRAEMFMTDLAISAGGLLGVLTTKGTATVRAYWRKQYPKQLVSPDDVAESKDAIHFSKDSTPTDVKKQIEDAIRIGVEAKKIIDTPLLRTELFKAAEDFQALASTLDATSTDTAWWVQRFRVDFSVDGSGHVNPSVIVGGEVRFRFEWHRIKRTNDTKNKIFAGVNKIMNQTELQRFVKNMSEDIEEAFPYVPEAEFQAHTMRMGIGVSAKGNIGVVKGSVGVVGQIYFTRDVKRPTKFPKPNFLDNNEPILIIERNPTPSHILFAQSTGSYFELNDTTDQIKEAIYKVNRKNFRKGLKKAAKISKFFIDRAGKQNGEGWKIFELRTSFDASISGELDMAVIQGAVTAQVNFFNQKF